eukprot:9612-Chlamydomonas_euryale.AAC.3
MALDVPQRMGACAACTPAHSPWLASFPCCRGPPGRTTHARTGCQAHVRGCHSTIPFSKDKQGLKRGCSTCAYEVPPKLMRHWQRRVTTLRRCTAL